MLLTYSLCYKKSLSDKNIYAFSSGQTYVSLFFMSENRTGSLIKGFAEAGDLEELSASASDSSLI